jgi:hypothetical protein
MPGVQETARLMAIVGMDPTDFLNKARQAEEASNKLGKQIEGAFRLAGIAMGVEGVKQAAGFAIELSQLGAQAERVGNAFDTLAGTQADAMLDRMRDAARGTISDSSMMLAANKAMMLGVTSNADEMARLLEVARVRGQAMGLSAEQAFSDIVTGIGRMSPMILDNLGILTGGEKGFQQYAESIGKSADALTDLEKRHYLLQKVLNDTSTAALAASQTLDQASNWERLDAGWQNWQEAQGKGMGGIGSIAGAAGGALSASAAVMTDTIGATEALRAFNERLRDAQDSGRLTSEAIGALSPELMTLEGQLRNGQLSAEEMQAELDRIVEAHPAVVAAFAAEAQAADALRAAMAYAQSIAGTLADDTARWMGHAGMSAGLVTKDPGAVALMGMGTNFLNYSQQPTPNADLMQREIEIRQRGVDQIYEVERERARASERAGDEYRRSLEAQGRELRGVIEGLLQPTSVTQEDAWLTKIGQYSDKWDEYVRRLRAAAGDAGNQWRSLIPTDVLAQGEEAVQAWVAQTERAFYSGQLPEQVNWEGFLGSLQQQIGERQAREALVQEAMQRAQAAGIGGSALEVQQALGLPTAPGQALAASFAEGAAQTPIAASVTAAFEEQIQGEQEHWLAMGTLCISWFEEGAKKGVTPQIGYTFARVMFPFLADMLDARRPRP